ncbi:MAG: hypothetical protein Q7R96_06710 [Nanoarchaeota archaeon]|nr:hypothetical protein [Nanoarchaeota archaeon]
MSRPSKDFYLTTLTPQQKINILTLAKRYDLPTAETLAKSIGHSKGYLSELLNGKTALPRHIASKIYTLLHGEKEPDIAFLFCQPLLPSYEGPLLTAHSLGQRVQEAYIQLPPEQRGELTGALETLLARYEGIN